MWQELAVAFSLVLVLEGLAPFICPERWRLWVYRLADMESKQVRWVGLLSMISGLVLLTWLR
ncbi:hypothetical protein IMCC21906_03072 [Spongiibacter sp. IMCC21906]|jgi:uncharacterized protein YjeT (DUF2065 family)|uniref:DUF2065 domain-containing protein n=1 Tax=Spongiibacter sp. IMCC21906 TaxID=1620392 RepID=UPI00062E088C|nr:DUF2065 family protein [Spongiibacter sp. IMCC21906]AKH70712.1 hypothetical protein IMCC21906_03072 [Spongiibacter sp. IMCC21906]